jgi:hypothetical protein
MNKGLNLTTAVSLAYPFPPVIEARRALSTEHLNELDRKEA